MALFKIRSLVPVRPGDDIDFSIVIEIAKVGALGPELVGKLKLFESVDGFCAVRDQRRRGDQCARQYVLQHSRHAWLIRDAVKCMSMPI